MGNTLTAPALVSTQQDLPTLLLDIPAYLHHSVLGGGKIFKTLQCLHEDGFVVIKLYVRRSSDFDLKRYEAKLDELCSKLPLATCPSILNLVKIEITDRAVYLGRQYFGSNLVDRFHVHPSLTSIEKQWLTYQMLHAVHQLHSHGIRHGDIKTENFLLTSWNWLFLVDIAFYKPTFLPNDNPADYHFFFENQGTMGSNGMITQNARRRCYLAPERFYNQITDRKYLDATMNSGSGGSDGQVSEAMDVFSLGCVIAELFLDGEQVLFDLPLLLAYREGEYDPTPVINKIPFVEVRQLIRHMIQRDPTKRFSAKQYMKIWSQTGMNGPAGLDPVVDLISFTPSTTSPSLKPVSASPPTHISSPSMAPLTPSSAAAANANAAALNGSLNSPLFPTYFGYLYRFFAKLLTPELADPDIKVQALKTHRDTIIREVLGKEYLEQLAKEEPDELEPFQYQPTATEEQISFVDELTKLKTPIEIHLRADNRLTPHDPSSWTCICCTDTDGQPSKFSSQEQFSEHILTSTVSFKSHAALFCPQCAPIINKHGITQIQAYRALGVHQRRKHGAAATRNLITSPNKPTSNTPQTIRSIPAPFHTPTPQGRKLLEELGAFGTNLSAKTATLHTLEELQADADAQRTAATPVKDEAPPAASAATVKVTKPTSSPLLSPSHGPSAASLLDLASAANPSATPLLSAKQVDTNVALSELDQFALEPGAPIQPVITYYGNGLTMICCMVCSCLQNVRYPITKLTALELLADFGAFVDDEVCLGRLAPYAVALLTDPSSMVRSTACQILTKLLSQVRSINSSSDAHLFIEYIFPSLSRFPSDTEEIVRLAYAQNIAELAISSKRFLDLAQTTVFTTKQKVIADDNTTTTKLVSTSPTPIHDTYQTDLATIQDTVLKLIIDMLTLGGSKVKRALLADIKKLCEFMGRKRVNNDLLPHLITVLNDRDWQLRSAFFEYIVGVSVFVGIVAFQNFVLPCIEQALFDVEEFVIQRAVHALTALSQLHLFEKRTMLEVGIKVGPLLCHPSSWIRSETIKFISSMSNELGLAKSHVFLAPILRPFLSVAPEALPDLSIESLHQYLKPHLTREEFRLAVQPTQREEQSGTLPTPIANNKQTTATPNKPINMGHTTPNAAIPFGESYAGPSRLLEATGGVGVSWLDHSGPLHSAATFSRPGGSKSPPPHTSSRPSLVPEETPASMEDSVDSASQVVTGSGFKDDPALFPVMSTYLARVSSAIQSKTLQSPSTSSIDSGRLTSMDEDSLLIELQNLSLSQTLEEQLPLHQLEIEPTVPELGLSTQAIANATALDRAAQETFDSLGVTGGSNRPVVRPTLVTPSATSDPSLIPASSNKPGLASPAAGLTAGATAQGGHPIALRESLSLVPDYVKRALGVPAPPPNLGNLRSDWITQSTFYANHRVLSTGPEALAAAEQHDPKLWRPKGILVATLAEHRHVRSLAVSRDNLFLVSGGDEGVVKIWDSQRLKLTAHARSQLSYVQHGRITSLAVCDSSHAVASASSNGSLHVFKVEYASSGDDNNPTVGVTTGQRYIGLSDVKRVDPDPVNGEGAILKVAHFNTLSESLLLYGTQKAVHGWDLRSKKESLELKLEPSMGLLTAMDIGPSPYVCITGTSRGFLTVWDLRFQLPVQVWRHSAKTAITNLTSFDAPSILPKELTTHSNAPSIMQHPHPTKGPLFFAAAEGTNQIGGFDIYTGESRMLFRVLNPTTPAMTPNSSGTGLAGATSAGGGPARKGSVSAAPTPSTQGALASNASYPHRTRQKVRVSPLSLPSLRSYIRNDYTPGSQAAALATPNHIFSSSSGFYQSLMGVTLDDSFLREFATMGSPEHTTTVTGSSINSFLVCKDSFALTAGTDKKIRFWDMRDPADSYRISSEDLADGDYLRYNSRLENTTVVLEEVLSNQLHPTPTGNSSTTSTATDRPSDADERARLKIAMAKKNSGQVPPSTAHSSDILDMKAIEHPQKMLATGGRDGVIKIWI